MRTCVTWWGFEAGDKSWLRCCCLPRISGWRQGMTLWFTCVCECMSIFACSPSQPIHVCKVGGRQCKAPNSYSSWLMSNICLQTNENRLWTTLVPYIWNDVTSNIFWLQQWWNLLLFLSSYNSRLLFSCLLELITIAWCVCLHCVQTLQISPVLHPG